MTSHRFLYKSRIGEQRSKSSHVYPHPKHPPRHPAQPNHCSWNSPRTGISERFSDIQSVYQQLVPCKRPSLMTLILDVIAHNVYRISTLRPVGPVERSSRLHGQFYIWRWVTPPILQSRLSIPPWWKVTGTTLTAVCVPSPCSWIIRNDLSLGIALYYGQLGLNYLWSPLFFNQQQVGYIIPANVFSSHLAHAWWLLDGTCFDWQRSIDWYHLVHDCKPFAQKFRFQIIYLKNRNCSIGPPMLKQRISFCRTALGWDLLPTSMLVIGGWTKSPKIFPASKFTPTYSI